jgi:hypothetical protein
VIGTQGNAIQVSQGDPCDIQAPLQGMNWSLLDCVLTAGEPLLLGEGNDFPIV